jgi:hypothetical protein
MRVSALAEDLGMPSASLCCEGFVGQAKSTSVGLGYPDIGIASVPGHVDTQSVEVLRENLLSVTLEKVIECLTIGVTTVTTRAEEREPREIVACGTFEEVNQRFIENEWSDGLPIVPPTIDKVEEFLAFTDRHPDEVLGILLPDSRAATVWTVAVNGVIAGCRPQYMPVLVALVEAMSDPQYGVEHSGNTPGSETLIILNGPIIQELGFNCEQGALRDGFQANTSIGRFWRLYLRNIPGFLPHRTDKATFGNTWRVVFAENEAALNQIGWPTLATERGIAAGDNAVTVARFTGEKVVTSVNGDSAEKILPYLANSLVSGTTWECVFTFGYAFNAYRPLLILSPLIAGLLASCGLSKADVRQRLFDLARIPIGQFENYIRGWTNILAGKRSIYELAKLGLAPSVLGESKDPNRLVPIVGAPEHFLLAVGGDPGRSNCIVFSHNGPLGFPTTKGIDLPSDWRARLNAVRRS